MSASPDIFLSYAREDQATARQFAEALQAEGFSVWWDQTLSAGEAFDQVTERALNDARAVVVLWSKHSVESRWVRAEAAEADEGNKLVPVLIEPCAIPIKFKLTQTADLSGWSGARTDPAWQGFVAALLRFASHRSQTADSAASEVTVATTARGPASLRQPLLLAAGIVGALILVGAGAWFMGRESRISPGASARAATTAPTIAVLPFADLSSTRDQEYFADGMTEEILNSLARIANLQVTGRTSSFYFKGRNENLKTIGETLGVEYLLEGSVRKAGNQLRITAQLIKAADGFHLWSQTYDRDMKDVFGIQEDIAKSVAETLQIALGVGELGQLYGMTRDVQAFESWLEGRSAMRELSGEGYLRSSSILEGVVEQDPNFVPAWLDLYSSYLNGADFVQRGSEQARTMFLRARQVLPEALQNNPDSELVEVVMRMETSLDQGDWLRAAAVWPDLDRVRRSYPSLDLFGPSTGRGAWNVAVDRASAAVLELEQMRRQDPLDSTVLVYLSEAYANVGRVKDALAEQDRAIARVPTALLAIDSVITAYSTMDPALIEKAWQRAQSVASSAVAETPYGDRSDPAAVRASLREALQAEPRVAPASRIALWAAIFGDPELALQALREDKDLARRRITALALWRPVMKDVRRLPGFKDLVRDWGLVDYWKREGWGDHCKPKGDDDFECH